MPVTKPILYNYYRSSCSYRVRIALALKNIPYECRPVNLAKGENVSDEHKKLNPKGEVPVLFIDDKMLVQSLPIIEYIDEIYNHAPKLLPDDAYLRYKTRMVSEIINSGIQPMQNLSILNRITEDKQEWASHFIGLGLDALEKELKETAGKYCIGDHVTMADCFLIPQLYNARRFKVDMKKYPVISAIEKELNKLDAVKISHPSQQTDCPEEAKDIL
ncbi:unnamed protein product [Didymodactylos carnosus]|nr:unnamed protein product [Didymodactylos carnosus]CAF3543951.1 unnamed protein product [Didymodactylos carnosus]